MYSFFTIYPEHSYGGTIVVLNRKYVLFKSHRQSSPQFVPYMFWGSHGILIGKCCLGCICLVFVFGCSSLVWDDTPILVFLNSFVMMLASFPMYINVGHFFLLSFFLVLMLLFHFYGYVVTSIVVWNGLEVVRFHFLFLLWIVGSSLLCS